MMANRALTSIALWLAVASAAQAQLFGGDDEAEQQVADENQLQVRLTPSSNRIEVSVDAGIEKAADSARARDLLERIQRGLNEGSNGGALLLPR